jgi:hypothetical protein
MIRLRREQIEAFGQERIETFVRRTVRRLSEDFPNEIDAQDLGGSKLEAAVRQGIATAQRYGIDRERDIAYFIDCMLLLGLKFDRDPRYPWASEVLGKTGLSGTEKVDLIHNHVVFWSAGQSA